MFLRRWWLLLLLSGTWATPQAQGAGTISYLHVRLEAPSNALLTEGAFARSGSAATVPEAQLALGPELSDPPPVIMLTGMVGYNGFTNFAGETLAFPGVGDFLATAAKDATYSMHAGLALNTEGALQAVDLEILLNSRERMSYDLLTDTFYYGTQAINFPRTGDFHIDFLYGGYFDFHPNGTFEIVSASGVHAFVTIVPEPGASQVLLWGGAALLGLARHRRARRKVG